MKNLDKMSYTDKIKWRIRLLWIVLVAMLVYMVAVAEFGGGDSRIMNDLSIVTSKVIFFGGFVYIAYRIYYNKKLLKNRMLLKKQREGFFYYFGSCRFSESNSIFDLQ